MPAAWALYLRALTADRVRTRPRHGMYLLVAVLIPVSVGDPWRRGLFPPW
ncbi:hypothetical protein PWG71_08965 [Nocardiopsis sp. N85]|nr:hypothetical protein [Nocardiopsis sp. N85]MDE3721517.1 hypothetical protein [Nocardiopsis sp. N85]